ncbi:hypothetical protein GCM10023200_33710 [Actinomycetospora chlora]|uniref:HNH nuclease domain-containing protein n=1 Tax=Actinomycetospora chlora TaxID=663608 RepID=A0ABP9BGD2_9PSEU
MFASLPEGIATATPGPVLGALLEQVDPRAVSAHDAVTLALGWRRQLSHHEARFALAAREAALADPEQPGERREGSATVGGDELRVALSESRTRVSAMLDRADTAIAAIPELWAAWDAGSVDADRVRLCVTWTSSLSTEHAARVVRTVLPEAPRLTLSGLIERLQQLASAIDPEWAARLYDNSRRQRRVRARRTESGTLNVSGLDLPLDAGARSVAHVDRLAMRAKALGHPGLLDTIRADLYLALLSPRTAGCDDDALVAAVVAAADPRDPRGRRTPVQHGGRGPAGDEPADPGDGHDQESDDRDDGEDGEDAAVEGGRRAEHRSGSPRGRIEVRVGLLTLLGLDEKPGLMPGYGVVHAAFARQFTRQLCRAEWRVAVTEADGHLAAALVTRRRPRGYATTPFDDPPVAPRPVVELLVTQAELTRLRLDHHPLWAEVVADLQDQLRAWHPPDENTPEAADRRAPSAALARWIQARDRSCVFPPCRASAVVADIDHTRPVAAHGRTLAGNLGPLCTHDHRLKHGYGWRLDQSSPGTFVWTSPTGHTYARPPRPVIPDLPDPAPGRYRSSTSPETRAGDDPIWIDDPYPDVPPPGRPPPGRPDDPPPF